MSIDITQIDPVDTMSPIEAARILRKNPERIRAGLRQGEFPFGSACQSKSGQWNYIIITKKFLKWIDEERGDLNAKGN